MKRIRLKTVPLSNSTLPDGFEFDYKKELLQITEILPEGATISQMSSALKIQKALKNANESLYLEDADWQWLKDKVTGNKWRIVAPELVDFEKAITEAATEDAPHLTHTATA
jgi:hypothetical protein